MKKKYLYNGQLIPEDVVAQGAKQNGVDIDTYIQKAGMKAVDDSYLYKGKEVPSDVILQAANQSKLGFDDYIQKAGFQKKNGGDTSSTTSVVQPAQPAPITSQSNVPSNAPLQKDNTPASVFDNPTLNPSLQKDIEQPLQPQPSLQEQTFDPMGFLAQDIAKTGNTDNINPNTDAGMQLQAYHAIRTKELNIQKAVLGSQLLNIHQDKSVQRGDMVAPNLHIEKTLLSNDNPDAVDILHKDITDVNDYQKNLDNSVRHAASIYVASQTKDAVKAGRIVRTILGDKTAIDEQNYADKDLPIPQSTQYYNARQGLDALQTGLDAKFADKTDPEYLKEKADLDAQSAGLLNKYPEFKHAQVARVIAQQIMKDHPNAGGMMQLPYANEAIEKLGIPKEDVKDIDFDNLPLQNLGTSTLGAIYNSALQLGAGTARLLGSRFISKDYLNAHLGEALKKGEERFSDVSGLQESPTIVDSDPKSNTYLQDIVNPDKGKYNYNFHTIQNAIGNGIGGLVSIVAGTKGFGSIAKSAIPALSEAAAADAGMAAMMIGQGYEGYYQKGREVIGDAPEDEFKRHLYALLSGVTDYAVFKPLGKLQEAISPTAAKELGAILKDAPSIEAVNKKLLTKWTTNVLKGAESTLGETAKIGGAQVLGDISKNIVDNVMGTPSQAKKSDSELSDHILTGISNLPFTMMVPLGMGEFAKGIKNSYTFKENIYNAGLNPETYLGQANDLLQKNVITQDQYNQRAQVINTAKDVVNSIPEDLNLNHNQKVKYVNSKLKEIAYQAKADKINDKGLEKYYENKIKEETDNRVSIMNGGGKESELENTPIGQTAEPITKTIDLNPPVTNDFTGKDNNFLANKEPDFFTPKERETYNELMKKPETEEQAAQMVADKKEEIKNVIPEKKSPISEFANNEIDKEIENTKAAIESAKMDEDFKFEGVGIKQLNEDLKILQSNPAKYFERRILELADDMHSKKSNLSDADYKQASELSDQYQKIYDDLTDNKEQSGDISEFEIPKSKQSTIVSDKKIGDEIDTEQGRAKITGFTESGATKVEFIKDGRKGILVGDINKISPKEKPSQTSSGEVKTISDAIKKHDEVENYTFDDMVNDIENVSKDSKVTEAVKKFRDGQEEDRKLSGRGDMDSAQKEFIQSVNPEKEVPKIEESNYRTPEEAEKILNEKVPFRTNYKTDVDYTDIITREKKTSKLYKAKDELAARYKNLQSLIVNCLT